MHSPQQTTASLGDRAMGFPLLPILAPLTLGGPPMFESRRRNVLRALIAVPGLGLAVDWLSADVEAHGRQDSPLFKRQMKAVNAIRLLNTALRRYRHENKTYTRPTVLLADTSIRRWLESEKAAKIGMDRAHADELNLRDSEMLPGWRAGFWLSPTADRYVLTLKNLHDDGLDDFATDETGVIHTGRLIGEPSVERWRAAKELITASVPARQRKPQLFAILQRLAAAVVVPVYATHCPNGECCCGTPNTCCHSLPCICLAQCQQGDPDPEGEIDCHNCGCQCCPWCCDVGAE